MLDRITGMRVFARAASAGSLSAAARHLGMSPAMATKHVDGEPAELGKNRTLRFSELPQRPEFPVFQLAALPPNVIAGQVDVLPAQWRKVLQ